MFKLIKSSRGKSTAPTLTTRLFSGVIDCTVVLCLLLPIQSLFTGEGADNNYLIQSIQNLKTVQEMNNSGSSIELPSGKQLYGVIISQLIQILAISFYVIFFWFKYQATPGKFLISAKIVSVTNGGKPTKKQLIIRYLGYALSALPLFIGFFIIPFNKESRALHDYLSGTKVISTKK
ncbi:MAG: RDD family protein [Rickettsiales bacterium]